MPLYEYSCHRCGQKFEVRQSFSEDPLKVHENCGGEVERLISAPSLHFKGSGWYVTDYAKGGASPSTSNAPGTETKPAASTETKSETKTETPKADSSPAPAKP